MENKEKKTSAVELNDENLENVSGGDNLFVPGVSVDVVLEMDCQCLINAFCCKCKIPKSPTNLYKCGDHYYCNACKTKLGL